jgi:hypothetical protein
MIIHFAPISPVSPLLGPLVYYRNVVLNNKIQSTDPSYLLGNNHNNPPRIKTIYDIYARNLGQLSQIPFYLRP